MAEHAFQQCWSIWITSVSADLSSVLDGNRCNRSKWAITATIGLRNCVTPEKTAGVPGNNLSSLFPTTSGKHDWMTWGCLRSFWVRTGISSSIHHLLTQWFDNKNERSESMLYLVQCNETLPMASNWFRQELIQNCFCFSLSLSFTWEMISTSVGGRKSQKSAESLLRLSLSLSLARADRLFVFLWIDTRTVLRLFLLFLSVDLIFYQSRIAKYQRLQPENDVVNIRSSLALALRRFR